MLFATRFADPHLDMVVHRRVVGYVYSINPNQGYKVYLSYMPDTYEIKCCLKSHLICHGHQNKMEAITSDAKDEGGVSSI